LDGGDGAILIERALLFEEAGSCAADNQDLDVLWLLPDQGRYNASDSAQ
jgi:hypothetical protein